MPCTRRERTAAADVCRQTGIREARFYLRRKESAHLGISEPRQLRKLTLDMRIGD